MASIVLHNLCFSSVIIVVLLLFNSYSCNDNNIPQDGQSTATNDLTDKNMNSDNKKLTSSAFSNKTVSLVIVSIVGGLWCVVFVIWNLHHLTRSVLAAFALVVCCAVKMRRRGRRTGHYSIESAQKKHLQQNGATPAVKWTPDEPEHLTSIHMSGFESKMVGVTSMRGIPSSNTAIPDDLQSTFKEVPKPPSGADVPMASIEQMPDDLRSDCKEMKSSKKKNVGNGGGGNALNKELSEAIAAKNNKKQHMAKSKKSGVKPSALDKPKKSVKGGGNAALDNKEVPNREEPMEMGAARPIAVDNNSKMSGTSAVDNTKMSGVGGSALGPSIVDNSKMSVGGSALGPSIVDNSKMSGVAGSALGPSIVDNSKMSGTSAVDNTKLSGVAGSAMDKGVSEAESKMSSVGASSVSKSMKNVTGSDHAAP